MGIELIAKEKAKKLKAKAIKYKRKQGRAGQHEDFMYNQPVTDAEKKRYLAAAKMGDTEYELGTKGYPRPKGPKFGAKPFKRKEGGLLSKAKKFLETGKKPSFEPGKGARPEGSPKATVFKSKTTKKPVANKKSQFKTAVEKSQNNARRRKNLKGTSTKKTEIKKVEKIPNILRDAIKGNKVDMKKIDSVKKGRAADEAIGRKPGSGVFYDKNRKKMLAAVTKEQLAKSGLSLNAYLNQQRGLTARKKTTTTPKANNKVTSKYTQKQKGYKAGGMTKRSFGGMAIKGVKDPSKIFKG